MIRDEDMRQTEYKYDVYKNDQH